MIFTNFNSTKDFKCNFNANEASDTSNDSMIVLDYYDGNKDFIDIGANNFEKVDFKVQIVDIGDDYQALAEYLRDNSGNSIPVVDKGNVLGFDITNFDFFLYGLEEEGESQFNFKTLSFSGCFRPNTTQTGQQFLLDIEINAFSVDVIIQTLPASGSFVGATYFEVNTYILWEWNGTNFEKLPTTKSYEVDYYVNTFAELPTQITFGDNRIAYVVSENKYYRGFTSGWVATPHPVLQKWKVVTLNDPSIGLKNGVVRFSSFYDYTDGSGNTYKSGFIAKKGVKVPKKKVKIQKGANVEILEGFKIKINNAERFSQDIVEFNFYGSICNLRWFDGTNSYLIRTGINKTNTVSEAVYEFSVEPFLWRDNEKYIPQKTLPNGADFVPQTFGNWDYAKLHTKNKSEKVLQQNGQKSFFIVNNGSTVGGKVTVEVAFQGSYYYTGYDLTNGNYKLKFPFSDDLFSYESYQINTTPSPTSPRGSFIFTMKPSSLVQTDILAGQLVSFVDLAFTLVIDDSTCGGFATSSGGGLDIYNYDSEKGDYVKINEGLFKAIDDHTIGINDKSFYTLDEDFNIKYLSNIKSKDAVLAGQLNTYNFTTFNPVTTPFGNVQNWDIKGVKGLDTSSPVDDWWQFTLVPALNCKNLKGLNPNNTNGGDVSRMHMFQYGYYANSGLMLKATPFSLKHVWVLDNPSSIYPKYERGVDFSNYRVAKTTYVKDVFDYLGNSGLTNASWIYQRYAVKGFNDFYNITTNEFFLGSSITYALNKKELEKLKGTKDVKLIGAFSFGMTSINNTSADYNSLNTTHKSRFQHEVKVDIFLRDSTGTLNDYLIAGNDSVSSFTDQIENNLPPYPTHHSPLNNNYVFCNVPKSLGGSDKFYDGMNTSNYTICRFKRSISAPIADFTERYKIVDSLGGEKSVAGVIKNQKINGDYWIELAMVDVVAFSISQNDTCYIMDENGNIDFGFVLTAQIDEFHDEILSGKDHFTIPDELFDQDMLINKYDHIVVLAKYQKTGDETFPNNRTKGFGTFSSSTNLYSAFNKDFFIDELNTDLDHCLYFSNEVESSLGGDGDGIFVKCKGREDSSGRLIDSAINVLNNQIKQINPDKTLRTENLPSQFYQIREQIYSKKTFKQMLMQFAEDTQSMIFFDRSDNLVAKSIDLRDFPPSSIKTFNKSNVLKNSLSKIKQSDFKDIATSISVKYHYHNGKGKVDKVITAKLSTDRTELIVTGLDPESSDSPDISAQKERAKVKIESLFEAMSISNQYYNTGRENNVEITRDRFFILEGSSSLANLANLFVKYAEYKIYNNWELSFAVSIDYFENTNLGDVISFELDSINSTKPVFGFVSGIEPKFYEGKCIFTLTTNVDPFLYSRLYDNTWDSGDVDLDDYDVSKRVNTEIFKLPYKDSNNVGTYPDSKNVDDSSYNLNNNQFTDNTFADADAERNPIT